MLILTNLLLFLAVALLVYWLYKPVKPAQPAAPAVTKRRPPLPNSEIGRFRFLVQRDGLPAALAWLQRAQAIYRAAYKDRKHKGIKSYRFEYLQAARDMRAILKDHSWKF